MVATGAGTHIKFARLTDAERCAHFLGVLSVASQAPVRGCLLVGDQEAEAIEVAREAGVPEKVAASTLRKLQAVGVLVRDDDLDCWRVHDWEDVNPEPKPDPTNAERQARYRARRKARNGGSNSTSNGTSNGGGNTDETVPRGRTIAVARGQAPAIGCARSPEGKEVEVENPPTPLTGDSPIERQATGLGFDEWLLDHSTVTGRTPPKAGSKARTKLAGLYVACCGEIEEVPPLPALKLATRGAHKNDFRREQGYDRAESVLRVTKVRDLIDFGKQKPAAEPRGDGFGDRLRSRNVQ